MKQINLKYDEENQKCFLTLYDSNETIEEIIQSNHITINIKTKEVDGIHSFFQKLLVEAVIASDFEKIERQTENVKTKSFFIKEEFQKLMKFIDDQIKVCNDTLGKLQVKINKFDGEKS